MTPLPGEPRVWQVSKWQDSLREVAPRKYDGEDGWAVYFGTREEAMDFIVGRASKAVWDAEVALKKADARLARAIKKYGSKS